MKKPIKLMGTALFAAALSFAVSSCEKVRTSVSEEGDAEVTEQTVDFGEITKSATEDLSESEKSIQDAIEDIVKSIAKQLGKAGEAVEGAIDDFQTELFDLFTYYGDTHEFDFQIESKKLFAFLFEFTVNNKNVKESDPAANYVSVSCKDRVLEIETKDGYWLKVYLPSWISGVYDKGGKLDFSTDLFRGCVYAVEIGKEDVVYGRKVLDTKEETATLTIYDLNVNDKVVAGATVDYSDLDDIVTSVWYDNAEVKVKDSLVVGTNIQVRDLDELFCTLSEIKDTYSYQPEDALDIVNDFNTNVLAYDELNTLHHPTIKKGNLTYPDLATPALVEGKPLCAAYFTEVRTQLCRVVVMHGDKVVTTGSVLEFVRYLLGEKKKDQKIAFEKDSYEAEVGETFTPVLRGAKTYVTYTSDNEEVAAVEPYTGEVTPKAEGTCTITATAATGVLYNSAIATCELSVTPAPASVLLPGEFSVSANKKVQFTKGNLYWDGTAWGLETNQTDYPTVRSTSHVSHLYWTKTAANSYAESYNDGTCTTTDKFFADGSDADHSLNIDGQSGLYALSSAEWDYLIKTRTNASGLLKYGVTVSNGGTDYANCLIIAPDDFVGTLKGCYTLDDVNASGLVCFPAAGDWSGSKFNRVGSYGNYWLATPFGNNSKNAYFLYFNVSSVSSSTRASRNCGYSVRLVCSVSSE